MFATVLPSGRWYQSIFFLNVFFGCRVTVMKRASISWTRISPANFFSQRIDDPAFSRGARMAVATRGVFRHSVSSKPTIIRSLAAGIAALKPNPGDCDHGKR